MKREMTLALLLCGATALANAQNYFTEGTVWSVHVRGDILDDDGKLLEYDEKFWLEGDLKEWGYDEGLILWQQREDESQPRHARGLIKTDGDKVYYRPHLQRDEWLLMYDFGVTAEEPIETFAPEYYWPNTYIHDTPDYFECLGRYAAPDYPELTIIKVGEFKDKQDFEPYGEGEILVGIGSLKGPVYNRQYGQYRGGESTTLTKVEHNGTIIYEATPKSEVTDIAADPEAEMPLYNLSGQPIESPAPGQPYVSGNQVRINPAR